MSDYKNTPFDIVPKRTGMAILSVGAAAARYGTSIPCKKVILQGSITNIGDTVLVSYASTVDATKGLVVPHPTLSAVISAGGVQSPILELAVDDVQGLWFYALDVSNVTILWRA